MKQGLLTFSLILLSTSIGCVIVSGDDTNAETGNDDGMTDTGSGDSTDGTGDSTGGGGVVFETDIYDAIFVPSCAGGGACHIEGMSGGLAMPDAATAVANLVGVASVSEPEFMRVVAGDPDASYVITKLEGNQTVGSQMPLGGMLTAEQIQTIRDWIAAGAS